MTDAVGSRILLHSRPELDQPPTPTRASFVVCSTQRCGSNLLCEGLTAAGAGVPAEYFHKRGSPVMAARWGVGNEEEYWRALLRHRTTPAGVFGIKLHYMVLNQSRAQWLVSLPAIRFVCLERQDSIRQAVSLARARMTGHFSQQDRTPAAVYKFREVLAAHTAILKQRAGWREFLNDVDPARRMDVTYSELVHDYAATVSAVAQFVGAPPVTPLGPPVLVRQADENTEEWAARFGADMHRFGVHIELPPKPEPTEGS